MLFGCRGGGSCPLGGSSAGSSAATPGVMMETKLKALVQKLADIHAKVFVPVADAGAGVAVAVAVTLRSVVTTHSS